MPQQGTEEQTPSEQSSGQDSSGKHRSSSSEEAPAEEASSAGQSGAGEQSGSGEQQSAPSEQATETQGSSSGPTEQATEKQQTTEKQQPAPDDAPTQKQQTRPRGGGGDTSWAEPEAPQRRSVDLGEIAWRTGNVIATVLRTLALLFALVLIVNVVLLLVGVNPANGVAQFVAGVADVVILGFRDLFLPADPTVALIVNSLVAAVFWVFVGELVSRLVRFVAARIR
ncbi:hypothetical protein [Actinomycetospora termitidis]|uniref:Uncharacterized protein n=1 Tax=Actinomycetospora termitidis TaxID=3053470 RepID=A0ABT7M5C6_9PSEU|nr:hypothetical protein [Actinomycetospora sp. Odt1-22]MDL5154648.1 hypothetical protein [Actinomycetospora sp. Odt1-22]